MEADWTALGKPMSFRKAFIALTLLALTSVPAFSSDKLIALTFDDGPRPYVLFGSKGEHPGPGLVSVTSPELMRSSPLGITLLCGKTAQV